MKLSGLNCGLMCIVCVTDYLVALTHNRTTTAIILSSLLSSFVPSSDASIEHTSISSVASKAVGKLSVEPSTVPSDASASNTQTSAEPSNLSSNTPTAASVKKPNILVILADDVGTGDIPLYWNSGLVDMPNVQRLANMGVTFKDAHSTPLCAPSRYMMLSGNYPHRGQNIGGTWNLESNSNQFLASQKSIAEVLEEGGNYSTAMYGKWHLGGRIPLAFNGTRNTTKILSHTGHNWTRPLHDGPQDIGFASSLITVSGIQDSPYSYFLDGILTTNISGVVSWDVGQYSMPRGTSSIATSGEGDPDWDSTAYNMVIINETTSFIDAHMTSDRSEDPWFIYAALGAAHIPHSPPDFYLDGATISGTYPTKHMDMLYEMDKAVGSLVTMIEERGLANDTIIIFTSDNGGVQNVVSNSSVFGHNAHGPLRGEKGNIYEGGHRVPMIFRHDGHFPVNETRSHMVGLNDIYKTLCKLIGIQVPEKSAQDSVSFADYIFSEHNKKGLRKNLATWVFNRERNSEAIRFGDMKLIRHLRTKGARTRVTTELYDLGSDIGEVSNLILNKNFAGIIKEMNIKLDRKGPCPKYRATRFKQVCRKVYGYNTTVSPTVSPVATPTGAPTAAPSGAPTAAPSGIPTAAPTGAPTTAPTDAPTTCFQNPKTMFNNNPREDCAWVTFKEKRRKKKCALPKILRNCPSSCGLCCADDDSFHFKASKGEIHNCYWIAKKYEKRKRECKKKNVRGHCHQTCGNCQKPIAEDDDAGVK